MYESEAENIRMARKGIKHV